MLVDKTGFLLETYCRHANFVYHSCSTVFDLVYAVSCSVTIVVKLCLNAGIKRRVVVCVSRKDTFFELVLFPKMKYSRVVWEYLRVIVIRLVLKGRVIPAISV
jgi:hypothetical protein